MQLPMKMRSRKLWVTIATFVLYGANAAFGWNLDAEILDKLAIVVSAYLVGQSVVDYGEAKERAEKYGSWIATVNKQSSGE